MAKVILCMSGLDEPVICIPANKHVKVTRNPDGEETVEIPLSMCEIKGSVSCFIREEEP